MSFQFRLCIKHEMISKEWLWISNSRSLVKILEWPPTHDGLSQTYLQKKEYPTNATGNVDNCCKRNAYTVFASASRWTAPPQHLMKREGMNAYSRQAVFNIWSGVDRVFHIHAGSLFGWLNVYHAFTVTGKSLNCMHMRAHNDWAVETPGALLTPKQSNKNTDSHWSL